MMPLDQIKTALRAGRYTDLGGYPLFFLATDGAVLSFETVRAEFRQVCADHLSGVPTGWALEAVEVNWEDADLYCDHSGQPIEAAYGGTA